MRLQPPPVPAAKRLRKWRRVVVLLALAPLTVALALLLLWDHPLLGPLSALAAGVAAAVLVETRVLRLGPGDK